MKVEHIKSICSIFFLPTFRKKVIKKTIDILLLGKTAKSILISCGARLAPFDIQELRELMSYDEMELDMLGDQRTACLSSSAIQMTHLTLW